MTLHFRRMESKRKILIRDLNPYITCTLCEGYLIDATTLVDCHHVFCRSCILKYFENCKTGCPTCNTVYKKKTQTCFKSDPQIQSLVYKLVPGLCIKEMQRREDFYRSTAVRASSSCSDDSVLERERDILQDQDERVSCGIGDKAEFFGPDDTISLSLEYYQSHLDTTQSKREKTKRKHSLDETQSSENVRTTSSDSENNNINSNSCANITSVKVESEEDRQDACKEVKDESVTVKQDSAQNSDDVKVKTDVKKEQSGDKRFLQCPAAVSMRHLQKFVRMKYALTEDHRVDIIYQGEVLPTFFSLMDVAYTFKWKRTKPMRFFYRIFTPLKVRPFKIINTTSSTGGKQLQIVPVKSSSSDHKIQEKVVQKSYEEHEEKYEQSSHDKEEKKRLKEKEEKAEKLEQQQEKKERLFAHLQLQSKPKVQIKDEATNTQVPEVPAEQPKTVSEAQDCIYTYDEPDKEEIKRFAEKRDREWALQKQLDEEYTSHHFTKKRKKNKHSKGDSMHKKRKLHAEITSNEKEDLKVKVKIIPHNGHKHKHHKSSQSQTSSVRNESKELSSKEKLLQMRQVRHKHVSSEDKNVQTLPPGSLSSVSPVQPEHDSKNESVSPKPVLESRDKCVEAKIDVDPPKIKPQEELVKPEKPNPVVLEPMKTFKPEPSTSTSSSSSQTVPPTEDSKAVSSTKTLRSDFPSKQLANREWGSKVPTVQLERNELTERQAQKTFLKTFQSYTEKYNKINNEKIQQNKNESNTTKMTVKSQVNALLNRHSMLEKKIASLQQQCTIESKPQQPKQDKIEKKPTPTTSSNDSLSSVLNTPYPPGFTVSKIEAGVKRKPENDDEVKDKRPSLEITLINPPVSSPTAQKVAEVKTGVKRPPPATIPLERIKKSNLKSGISIIPKMPEKCDNIGALDLSKPNKSPEGSPHKSVAEIKPINGFNLAAALASRQMHNATPRPPPNDKPQSHDKNMALSNLQMLSKVATEHPTLNKHAQNVPNKPRPQMPNLQTLKIPHMQNSSGNPRPSNLAKLPKLNEINKSQFRFASPQIRNLRPNQNQSIRNIPNPSLLVRQQNQNRLNSMNSFQNSSENQQKSVPTTSSTSIVQKEATEKPQPSVSIEPRISEKKEITVEQ